MEDEKESRQEEKISSKEAVNANNESRGGEGAGDGCVLSAAVSRRGGRAGQVCVKKKKKRGRVKPRTLTHSLTNCQSVSINL